MKHTRTILTLAAWLCAGLAADLGAAPAQGWTRSRTPHVPHVKVRHIKTPRAPRIDGHRSRR